MGLKCEIKFNQNPLGVYETGSTVSGVATIIFDKSRKVISIKLKVIGLSSCEWTEKEHYKEGRKTRSRNVTYKAREDYFETNCDLVSCSYDDSFKINPGIHSYDFSCLLPHSIPSSFEGGVGHIRYLVKVVIQRPGRKESDTFDTVFTVIKTMDLNNCSMPLSNPVQMEAIRYYCCGKYPLMCTVSLPYTGFVSGQAIPVTLQLNNDTSLVVTNVSIKLIQNIKYISHIPHQANKEEKRMLIRARVAGVQPQEHKVNNHSILIPSVPPTNTSLCSIIQISYFLQVKAHLLETIEIPITIGTVPLQTARPVIRNIPAATAPDSIRIQADRSTLEPPSYEQAVGIDNQGFVQDENATKQLFAPRYPVYNFNATAPIHGGGNEAGPF